MKKPNAAKNSKPRLLPESVSPQVAQAVLEDAMMEAAADIAALSATLETRTQPAVLVAETPEEEEILTLVGIPLLGPTRRDALAEAGIKTRADLEAATPEQIGGVKGVGMGNAKRIKDWLAAHSAAPVLALAEIEPPPPPLELRVETEPSSSGAALDLAAVNQAIQDVLERIDHSEQQIKQSTSAKVRDLSLDRQFDKLETVASELAEGPDTLTVKQIQQALRTLGKIADILEEAADAGKLSPKKQADLSADLRARRKKLQKALGE